MQIFYNKTAKTTGSPRFGARLSAKPREAGLPVDEAARKNGARLSALASRRSRGKPHKAFQIPRPWPWIFICYPNLSGIDQNTWFFLRISLTHGGSWFTILQYCNRSIFAVKNKRVERRPDFMKKVKNMYRITSVIFELFIASIFLVFIPVSAVQTENRGIHAVPCPGKVVIDGKLDDWDLSGQVLQCYDVEALKDTYSGQVAMMYDAENFYVSIHWKDSMPMGNSHDPHYQADKGWAGDAVQLRIKTDVICHVTAWYYAAAQEPFMNIEYGKSLTDPFGGGSKNLYRTSGWVLSEGAEMAFLKDADGRGYVQEMKLPWKVITRGKKYSPGDTLVCGVELLWGEGDWPIHRYADNLAEGATSREFFWSSFNAWGQVILEPKGNLKLPVASYLKALEPEVITGPVEISYSLPEEARVTIAINDETGKRVRNLVPALPRKKGPNVERWDGLDDEGKPVLPGRYAYTGIYHKGIHVNYVMSFANPGNPSWDTPDGRGAFYGDHTGPQGVATAGDYVALACPMGEAGKHLIGCDLTGQRLWGLANRVAFDGGHISLATDGKILYVATEGKQSLIYRVEIGTGKYAPWQATAKDAEGREYQILDLMVSNEPGIMNDPKHRTNMSAIALGRGELAVCLSKENQIKILDANTGQTKKTIDIVEPRSVVIDADNSLIVLSKIDIMRVSKDNRLTPFCSESFPDGYSLAIDAGRNVYLSVRGREQNVKVFSPGGKFLREIGKRGGRPSAGPFDENAMLNPAQIAVDRQGRLWVTEETQNPKRTSVWTADGKFVKDFIGTTAYAGAGGINPDDPTMAFSDNTVYKIDLDRGTWRPVYSLGRSDNPADIFSPSQDGSYGIGYRFRVVTHNGLTYLYTTGSARGAVETDCIMLKNGKWREAAHFGIVKRENAGEYTKYLSPLFEGHDNQTYIWTDQNGDGLVQANELTFSTFVKWESNYWGQLPGPDGTVPFISGQRIMQFPVTGFNSCDAPVYDLAHPKILNPEPKITLTLWEGMLMGGTNGMVYLNMDPLSSVDSHGRVLFTYPSHHISVHGSHTSKAARPGYLIGPSSILGTADFGGEIGEVFYLNGNLGENYIFTADGLYVQTLFKDVRGGFETPAQAIRGMAFDGCTAGGESFGGNFIRANTGKVYIIQGGTDARVLEATGFETIKRIKGEFEYTPAQFAEAQRLAQEKTSKAIEPKSCTIRKSSAPVIIDGKADEWQDIMDDTKPLVEIQESAQKRYGRVQARYDADNLYLGYRVFTPSGKMQNAGQNYQLLFKTGDCVDLMLGQPGKEDTNGMRLLLTVMQGQPVAVLYERSVPGTVAKVRVGFTSPWRSIYFDRVRLLGDIKVAVAPIHDGYFAEVQVPWSKLGIKPVSGLKLRGDFGILFADSGGTTTVSRQYWSNKATGLVNDVPGEAELTPNMWAELILE